MKNNYYFAFFMSMALASCSYAAKAPKNIAVDKYVEIPVGFDHKWNKATHPFTGAAVIDIDGDKKMEFFVGGSQEDALF